MNGSLAATVIAPSAPGRLGTPVDAPAALHYLEELARWRDARRLELDQLDQAALAAPARVRTGRPAATTPAAVTGDIMLSLALWKAAADRYALLLQVWDSGRVGSTERTRMSALIWGRLDATVDPTLVSRSSVPGDSALAVSLPEACRLSDALAAQLRVRLGIETSGAEVTERVRQLRAQLERIRDQVGLEPAGRAQQEAAGTQSRLARRLQEVTDKASRGGDVGGLLGPLEADASVFERDLIVHGSQRRAAAELADQATQQQRELRQRAGELGALVAECIAAVTPAPRYAVPAVDALGPVPATSELLTAYRARQAQVARAMSVVQQAYGGALAERAELLGRLEAYRAKAEALGYADRPGVADAYALASSALHQRPCRMALARQLVPLYQTYVTLESG